MFRVEILKYKDFYGKYDLRQNILFIFIRLNISESDIVFFIFW